MKEDTLYRNLARTVNEIVKVASYDANEAVETLRASMAELQPKSAAVGVDIISQADERYETYKTAKEHFGELYIPSGLQELDEIINGWHMGEELVCVFARTGVGKSWIMVKFAQSAWKFGKNVGFISPEMSPDRIGFRFDSASKGFSATDLIRGDEVDGYKEWITELKGEKNKFVVATPKEFGAKVTVEKLRAFATNNELEILFIDEISSVKDTRPTRGRSITDIMTQVAEDLMELSLELGIPIIVTSQANRKGATDETPELETIRNSDGISHKASKVISLYQRNGEETSLEVSVKKHRDGKSGDTLRYRWYIDKGEYEFEGLVEKEEQSPQRTSERHKQVEEEFFDDEGEF